MKYLLSIILNVAVGQNIQSVKIAVGQKCRRSKLPSVKIAVGQNGSRSKIHSFKTTVGQNCRRSKIPSVKMAIGQNGHRSKLRRSKDLEPILSRDGIIMGTIELKFHDYFMRNQEFYL
jgi:hypothetical protein